MNWFWMFHITSACERKLNGSIACPMQNSLRNNVILNQHPTVLILFHFSHFSYWEQPPMSRLYFYGNRIDLAVRFPLEAKAWKWKSDRKSYLMQSPIFLKVLNQTIAKYRMQRIAHVKYWNSLHRHIINIAINMFIVIWLHFMITVFALNSSMWVRTNPFAESEFLNYFNSIFQ